MRRGSPLTPRGWAFLAGAFVLLTVGYGALAPAPSVGFSPWSLIH